MARCMSSAEASATSPSTSSVAGLTFSNRLPDAASTSSPSISMRTSPWLAILRLPFTISIWTELMHTVPAPVVQKHMHGLPEAPALLRPGSTFEHRFGDGSQTAEARTDVRCSPTAIAAVSLYERIGLPS